MTAKTDRELLELAAKAAGIKVFMEPYGAFRNCTGMLPCANFYSAPAWNPLTDDGDALRLAGSLELLVDVDTGTSEAGAYRGLPSIQEDHNGDAYSATRRAIVRAAAAIGETL